MNDKIEQCKKDIEALRKELKRLEDEAKPKLRHGDYGFYCGSRHDPCVVYHKYNDKTGKYELFSVVNTFGVCEFDLSDNNIKHFEVIGNVFDDLKGK